MLTATTTLSAADPSTEFVVMVIITGQHQAPDVSYLTWPTINEAIVACAAIVDAKIDGLTAISLFDEDPI